MGLERADLGVGIVADGLNRNSLVPQRDGLQLALAAELVGKLERRNWNRCSQ